MLPLAKTDSQYTYTLYVLEDPRAFGPGAYYFGTRPCILSHGACSFSHVSLCVVWSCSTTPFGQEVQQDSHNGRRIRTISRLVLNTYAMIFMTEWIYFGSSWCSINSNYEIRQISYNIQSYCYRLRKVRIIRTWNDGPVNHHH